MEEMRRDLTKGKAWLSFIMGDGDAILLTVCCRNIMMGHKLLPYPTFGQF